MANQGPLFGLHRDCRLKICFSLSRFIPQAPQFPTSRLMQLGRLYFNLRESDTDRFGKSKNVLAQPTNWQLGGVVIEAKEKFDPRSAVTALKWIEAVLDRRLAPDRDVANVKTEEEVANLLRDGTALCELMNKISPGAITKYHRRPSAFQQMENVELFLKACVRYGMGTIDTFQVKELYEARAIYLVINCLYALGSLAQRQGFRGPRLGVKLASRNERQFGERQQVEARRTVSRQNSAPPDAPTQPRMTPYGMPRQILMSGDAHNDVVTASHTVIGLQYGSNQVASQSGMTAYGMPRQISTSSIGSDDSAVNGSRSPRVLKGEPTIGLQYGSNRVASQSGMTAYGMPRQIVSSASCESPYCPKVGQEFLQSGDDSVFSFDKSL